MLRENTQGIVQGNYLLFVGFFTCEQEAEVSLYIQVHAPIVQVITGCKLIDEGCLNMATSSSRKGAIIHILAHKTEVNIFLTNWYLTIHTLGKS